MATTLASPRVAITERLARFAVSIRGDDIPADLVTRAKLSFLDTLGATIGGAAKSGHLRNCMSIPWLGHKVRLK